MGRKIGSKNKKTKIITKTKNTNKTLISIMFMYMLKNQKQGKEEQLNQKIQIIIHYQIQ